MRQLLGLAIEAAGPCLPGVGSAHDAKADTWRTYVNVRFGYRICFPSNLLRVEPESPNGDGRVFTAADAAKLTAFGRNNAEDSSLAETAAEARVRSYRRQGQGQPGDSPELGSVFRQR
ncbi:hypothetical protein [Sphingomonas xinjiangensis]|uniref:Uncharacterized protein n=1 Tax=Sphingomonas xinjiangensis TaxID=643568 RepID=A0A840YEJ5_9SPHN|nr:hypothetical protein [Sphingomonas xinjiangensis]MBB5710389.1 hypothetical protein [Sphingomonas xinjiangensis]